MRAQLTTLQLQASAMEKQVGVMERQTEAAVVNAVAAKEGAEAANRSVEMFINKERARLRVDLENLDLSLDILGASSVKFKISISGATSAYIIETRCSGYVVPAEWVDGKETADRIMLPISSLPQVIPPNSPPFDGFTIFHHPWDGQTEELITEVKADRLFVGLRGFIKYKDVFDRERETNFRYVWKYFTFPAPAGSERWGSWHKCGAEEENKET